MEFYKGKNFWKKGNEPVSEVEIMKAEKLLGVSLPISFLNLLRENNGGSLEFPYFFIGNSKERYGLYELEGICFDNSNMFFSQNIISEYELPNNIILLEGDYHYWIAFDYRDKAIPSIIYLFEDYTEDEVKWDSVEIASDFDTFLTKLFQVPSLNPKKLKTTYSRPTK
ncbi:SMI1/KNR4 family protein [Bacillus sp. AFS041924]|uniref:SMI1/KNR4 family protein n=1 Tax=Bacillus sp. AFS041924 TaxID=2033503 RepID=UPI000BFDBD68|nr:SMI1/KNR4 family protein [Bacillus sp. AFS041924]PGS53691.1 SMI1/KNR4 family protein [Bacillus sp. AFS041924]